MYSKREELVNAVTHGLGIILGIIGLIILLQNDTELSPYSSISIWIYGLSIIVLYAASTTYHVVTDATWKRRARILDHISIYYLIAGTYTPVCLISLLNSSGVWMFWTVWGIALLGTLLKLFFTGRFEKLSLLLYLFMGWVIVFDLTNVIHSFSAQGLWLLALGGAFYTIGTIFYAIHRIPYNHGIWHLFVLAGSIFHYFFVLLDVI